MAVADTPLVECACVVAFLHEQRHTLETHAQAGFLDRAFKCVREVEWTQNTVRSGRVVYGARLKFWSRKRRGFESRLRQLFFAF